MRPLWSCLLIWARSSVKLAQASGLVASSATNVLEGCWVPWLEGGPLQSGRQPCPELWELAVPSVEQGTASHLCLHTAHWLRT